MRAKSIHEYLDVYHFVKDEKILDSIKKTGFKFNSEDKFEGKGLLGAGFYSLYNINEEDSNLMGEIYSKYLVKYSIPINELKKNFIINDETIISKLWGYKKPDYQIHDEIFFPELVKDKDYPFGEPEVLKNIPRIKNSAELNMEIKKTSTMSFSEYWIYRALLREKNNFTIDQDEQLSSRFHSIEFQKYWNNTNLPEWNIIEDFENDKKKYDDPIEEKIKETNSYNQLMKKGFSISSNSSRVKSPRTWFLPLNSQLELGLRGYCGNYNGYNNLFFTNDKSLLKNPEFIKI